MDWRWRQDWWSQRRDWTSHWTERTTYAASGWKYTRWLPEGTNQNESKKDITTADPSSQDQPWVSNALAGPQLDEPQRQGRSDTFMISMTTLAGRAIGVEAVRDQSLGALLLQLPKITGYQAWQHKLVLQDGTLLEGTHRPLSDWLNPDLGPVHLSLVTSRSIPDHVQSKTNAVFDLIVAGDASGALTALMDGDVNVNARADISRLAKGRKSGGESLLLTALQKMSGLELRRVARTLLEMGAKPYFAAADGTQPLHVACAKGEGEVAQALLQHSADPTVLGTEKQSPLHLAMEHFLSVSLGSTSSKQHVALGKACSAMVIAHPELAASLNGRRVSPTHAAREALYSAVALILEPEKMRLSQAKPITRDEVIGLSRVPACLLYALGDEVWKGWPDDFLPEHNEFITKCFSD